MEFLILWTIFAFVTAIIASSKGRNGFGWFISGAVIGIFGIVLVAVMPSLKTKTPYGTSEPTKRYSDCGETVLAIARVCKHCGHRFAAAGAVE